jgi:hypothetical protein
MHLIRPFAVAALLAAKREVNRVMDEIEQIYARRKG